MNPILTGSEVRMNEEHAGRYPLAARVLHAALAKLPLKQRTHLNDVPCTICRQFPRKFQGYGDQNQTDNTYYAACANCGQWDPL